jgi:hypothetical protein
MRDLDYQAMLQVAVAEARQIIAVFLCFNCSQADADESVCPRSAGSRGVLRRGLFLRTENWHTCSARISLRRSFSSALSSDRSKWAPAKTSSATPGHESCRAICRARSPRPRLSFRLLQRLSRPVLVTSPAPHSACPQLQAIDGRWAVPPQYVPQYLLPFAAGQLPPGCAHFCVCFSAIMSSSDPPNQKCSSLIRMRRTAARAAPRRSLPALFRRRWLARIGVRHAICDSPHRLPRSDDLRMSWSVHRIL